MQRRGHGPLRGAAAVGDLEPRLPHCLACPAFATLMPELAPAALSWRPRLPGISTAEGKRPQGAAPSADGSDPGGVDTGAEQSLAPGLYVHVPFCSAICPYCDFAVVRSQAGDHGGFVDALVAEARSWGAWSFPEKETPPFDTVYLGGGTPSALAPDLLARLQAGLRRELPIAAQAEWSIEVNPEDVDASRAAAWRALGFSAISLGVQALDDVVLRDLGRRHSRDEALNAIETALGAGFSRVNVDLIYATGRRTLAQWRRELSEVVGLGLEHLSCYELTFHQGTPFDRQRASGRRAVLAEDQRADWFLETHRTLAGLGLEGYEVSNFARGSEHQARHNQKYWQHQPYLGLGPSAHSFDGASRWWNVRALAAWRQELAAAPDAGEATQHAAPRTWIEQREELRQDELLLEAIHLGLRTRAGIDLALLRRRYGCDLLSSAKGAVERGLERGLFTVESGRLASSLEGWLVSDALTVELTADLLGEGEQGKPRA